MTYKQAISYLYSLEEERINLGLSRIKSLLFNLCVSPGDLKVIHVAGTNGKGSVVAMVSSILSYAGFKVGVYTSPHLKDFRERIVIKSCQRVKYIPKKGLIRLVEKIQPIVKKISRTKMGKPTFFEVTTAIMFAYFTQEEVDFAVLEVGLGGRLDATNVVLPLVSVITNIGLEHTDRLGNTLEEIAKEKCGIIKSECPVITAEQKPIVLKVIKNVSRQRNAKLIKIIPHPPRGTYAVMYKYRGFKGKMQFFDYYGLYNKFKKLSLPFFGKHQLANASCAIAALERCQVLTNDKCTYTTISSGLRYAKWPGRCEVVSRRPYIVVDGAHNPAAANLLASTIKNYFHYSHIVLILGILRDKDINGIMSYLSPISDSIIFTSPASSRAASAMDLLNSVSHPVHSSSLFVANDVPQAIKLARQIASRHDLILITGSLYTVADANA